MYTRLPLLEQYTPALILFLSRETPRRQWTAVIAELARRVHYLSITTAQLPPGRQLQADLVQQLEDLNMLRLALMFLVIAIVAAFFGFGLVAGMAYDAAKIFFFIFVVLAVLAFIGGALRSPPV